MVAAVCLQPPSLVVESVRPCFFTGVDLTLGEVSSGGVITINGASVRPLDAGPATAYGLPAACTAPCGSGGAGKVRESEEGGGLATQVAQVALLFSLALAPDPLTPYNKRLLQHQAACRAAAAGHRATEE